MGFPISRLLTTGNRNAAWRYLFSINTQRSRPVIHGMFIRDIGFSLEIVQIIDHTLQAAVIQLLRNQSPVGKLYDYAVALISDLAITYIQYIERLSSVIGSATETNASRHLSRQPDHASCS